jgi:hypothetical protein
MENKVIYGEAPYAIEMTIHKQGEDVVLQVEGGTHPHIGAVCTAYWQDGECIVHLVELPHHKEGELAKNFAKQLCEMLKQTATVICGIHIDNATREEIERLVHNTHSCFAQLVIQLNEDLPDIRKTIP